MDQAQAFAELLQRAAHPEQLAKTRAVSQLRFPAPIVGSMLGYG